VSITAKVIPVERAHSEMLCTQRVATTICRVSKAALAAPICDAANLPQFATQLHHGIGVATYCEMRRDGHPMADLMTIADAPVTCPQSISLAHPNSMTT
jgi:hypothetical protein